MNKERYAAIPTSTIYPRPPSAKARIKAGHYQFHGYDIIKDGWVAEPGSWAVMSDGWAIDSFPTLEEACNDVESMFLRGDHHPQQSEKGTA